MLLSKVEEIGRSHEARPILLLKICPNRKCGARPAIWFDSGIHGREWIGPAVMSFLARVSEEYMHMDGCPWIYPEGVGGGHRGLKLISRIPYLISGYNSRKNISKI